MRLPKALFEDLGEGLPQRSVMLIRVQPAAIFSVMFVVSLTGCSQAPPPLTLSDAWRSAIHACVDASVLNDASFTYHGATGGIAPGTIWDTTSAGETVRLLLPKDIASNGRVFVEKGADVQCGAEASSLWKIGDASNVPIVFVGPNFTVADIDAELAAGIGRVKSVSVSVQRVGVDTLNVSVFGNAALGRQANQTLVELLESSDEVKVTMKAIRVGGLIVDLVLAGKVDPSVQARYQNKQIELPRAGLTLNVSIVGDDTLRLRSEGDVYVASTLIIAYIRNLDRSAPRPAPFLSASTPAPPPIGTMNTAQGIFILDRITHPTGFPRTVP